MDREVWDRITEVFDAALDVPAAERDAFVARACGGNEALLTQVRHLLGEFEKAGQFLEAPLLSPDRGLPQGEVIAGRYRIEALLGRGGMGEVYRAYDEVIEEAVALKILRRELGNDLGFVRRFRREVQLARKITHPNVCRLFEVGIHVQNDGRRIHFFTMELLEGETLAAQIARGGRLAPAEALPIVEQMAHGLDAAHRAGIVHGDFKSANVMLCRDRAVVTDFGLASATAGSPAAGTVRTISVDGRVAGTVGYMSPEQLSGRAVATATDIYSLGIVLFEMTTGRLPFDDEHIIRSAMERAAEPAPNVRALAPDIDPQWSAVIARCLRREPSQRYSSARSVASQLQPRWRPPALYWSRRQWLTAAGAAAGGLALIPLGMKFSRPTPVLPAGAQTLLIPLTNSTGNVELDGIGELFRNQLAQSVHTRLLERQTLASALTQMGKPPDSSDPATLREAAWRINAVASVFGSLSRIGPDYALNVQVETRGSQPDNPRTKTLRSFPASDPSALMRAVRDASLWVRQTIGESAGTIASFDRLPADTTTPSWRALTLYAQGEQFVMKNDFNPALDLFTQALAEDPQFTLAAMRRADLLTSQDRHSDSLPLWRTALAMLPRRPVTRAEELYGRGMFGVDSWDLDAADLNFRTWSREYPHEWRAPFYRTAPLCQAGHATQALELLTRVQQQVPDFGDVYVQMISCHLMLGQTDRARALLPDAYRLNRRERVQLREAYIVFREGDCVGYLEALRALRRDVFQAPAGRRYLRGAFDSVRQEGLFLIDAGYPEAAAAVIEEVVRTGSWSDVKPQLSVLRIVQAWAELLAGNSRAAIEHARSAVGDEPGPVILMLGGALFARLGRQALSAAVLRVCEDNSDILLYRHARHRIAGEIARASGRHEDALRELRSAAALEPRLAHRPYLIEALPEADPERLELSLNVVRHPWLVFRPPPLHCIGSLAVAVPTVNEHSPDTDTFATRFAASATSVGRLL